MQKRTLFFMTMGIVVALVLFTSLRPALGQNKEDKPKITITSTPSDPPGPNMASEPIKGTVTGGDPKDQKVVIYARGGDTWWVQPTVAEPYTDFEKDGSWESETHGATRFVALLVRPSYKPEATVRKIPDVRGDVLAKSETAPPGMKPGKKSDKKAE